MPIIYKKWIRRHDLIDHRDWLFVFGDNMARKGYGGQAKEMRGEPNAIGIPTKWKPDNDQESFFTDEDLNEPAVIDAIDDVFVELQKHLDTNGTVVFPEDDIGTGLARLPECAPRIYAYIQYLKEGLLNNENQIGT